MFERTHEWQQAQEEVISPVKFQLLPACNQEDFLYLATLWYEEISRKWNPEATVERAMNILQKHRNTDTLPLTVVALVDDKPAGMASLRKSDGLDTAFTPWLGSLVVDPKFRGRGIGENLIHRIKLLASGYGYRELYLFTLNPTIPEWYVSLGWQHVGDDEYCDHPVRIMKTEWDDNLASGRRGREG